MIECQQVKAGGDQGTDLIWFSVVGDSPSASTRRGRAEERRAALRGPRTHGGLRTLGGGGWTSAEIHPAESPRPRPRPPGREPAGGGGGGRGHQTQGQRQETGEGGAGGGDGLGRRRAHHHRQPPGGEHLLLLFQQREIEI